MAEPLELNINGRIINQARFHSGVWYLSPNNLFPLIVLSENIAFPIVNIKQRFGPYSFKQVNCPESREKIEQVMAEEVRARISEDPMLRNVNGLIVLDDKTKRIRIPGRKGTIGIREEEKVQYGLVEYSLTDNVLLRTLGSGKMYED